MELRKETKTKTSEDTMLSEVTGNDPSMCGLSSCDSPYFKGKREIYFIRYLAAQIFVGVQTL